MRWLALALLSTLHLACQSPSADAVAVGSEPALAFTRTIIRTPPRPLPPGEDTDSAALPEDEERGEG